jgi:hypothetical protein
VTFTAPWAAAYDTAVRCARPLVVIVVVVSSADMSIAACTAFTAAGSGTDAGARSVEDPTDAADAGPMPVDPVGHGTVQCIANNDASTCAVGHPCCAIFGNESDRCVDAGTSSCSTQYPSDILYCDDSADCWPNVCCAFVVPGKRFTSRCVRSDECVAPNLRMCVSPADCPDRFQSCKQIALDTGPSAYQACQ